MTRDWQTLDARLQAVHDQLTASVETLASSDAWAQMLAVASGFHRYSPNNVLLITVQRPEATLVAGYRTWQQLGRQVVRGEQGIAILAPVITRADPEPRLDEQGASRVPRHTRFRRLPD
jgi:hypothetical protein